MITQSEVRKELFSYLKNSISLDDFESWLVSKSWNMHLDSDQDVIDLVDDIELSLAEYSNSDLTIQELQQRFWETAKNVTSSVNSTAPVSPRYYKNASSSTTVVRLSVGALA